MPYNSPAFKRNVSDEINAARMRGRFMGPTTPKKDYKCGACRGTGSVGRAGYQTPCSFCGGHGYRKGTG